MGWRYVPIVSTPNPPFDVTLALGATWVAATAVVAHLAPHPWHLAPEVALAAGLAALTRRRWRRQIANDPGTDLYMVLLWPTWGALVALLAVLLVVALIAGEPPGPVAVAFVLFSVAGGLPSVWFTSAFAGAAARGGALPAGSRARSLVGISVWRTAAIALWPVEFFGVFDTMHGRASVAALVTALSWLAVVAIGVAHLRARLRGNQTAPPPPPAPPPSERQYREAQERFEQPPSAPPEPDIRPLMARELRWDALAFLLVSFPLALHVVLLAI